MDLVAIVGYCLLLLAAYLLFNHVLLPYCRFKLFVRTIPKAVNAFVYPFVPVLGYIFAFKIKQRFDDYLQSIRKDATEVPNLDIAVSNQGGRVVLALVSSKYIKSFSEQQSRSFKKTQLIRLFKSVIGDGLLFLQFQEHARRRKILSQIFNFQFINSQAKEIYSLVSQRIEPLAGSNVETIHELIRITSSIILTCFLGVKAGSTRIMGQQLCIFISSFFQEVNVLALSPMYILTGKTPKQFRVRQQQFQRAVEDLIRQHIASQKGSQKKYLVDLLLQRQLDKDAQRNIKMVSQEFKTFFFAGTDTSSHLASVAIYYLIKYPDIASRIRQEISDFDPQSVDFNSGKQFKILNAFIKQVQRVYGPANSLLLREAVEDVYLQDLFVPKDTLVALTFDTNMYRPQNFSDPLEFKVERWLQNQVPKDPYTFVPFGTGSRNCIGQHLALFEVRIILIEVLRRFDLSGDPNFDGVMTQKGMPYFKLPFMTKFQKRHSSS